MDVKKGFKTFLKILEDISITSSLSKKKKKEENIHTTLHTTTSLYESRSFLGTQTHFHKTLRR